MTNYERIKAMSIDEMSEFLIGLLEGKGALNKIYGKKVKISHESIPEWLSSENPMFVMKLKDRFSAYGKLKE